MVWVGKTPRALEETGQPARLRTGSQRRKAPLETTGPAVPMLKERAPAAALREGVQQALVAGDAHRALAAADPFRGVFQRSIAAAALDGLLGLLLIFVHERLEFHVQSFLLESTDALTRSSISTFMPSELIFRSACI